MAHLRAMIRETAPAKINLALHVTGRRSDGYHLLDSLVAFTALGDEISLTPGPAALTVTGPFARDLDPGPDNLCLKALRLAGAEARITLDKRMPVAAGIGGGSADAAAVLRALMRMDIAPIERPERLGADVPVCLASRPTRMQGTGEVLIPAPMLPEVALVLANPGQQIATPAVFAALSRRDNPGLPPLPGAFPDAAALIDWLEGCRNDLEEPAIRLAPAIADTLAALRASGAGLARMSGSGATCFGLFQTAAAAAQAAAQLRAAQPGWWVAATNLRRS